MIGGRFKVASVASVAAAGLMMGGVAAQAADLGGNCCADLEERVAELEATTARKGNRRQSLTIYGQVAKGIVWHDDDDARSANEVTIRDMNGRSGTRFGFRGSAKINADVSAGFLIEIGVDNAQPISGARSPRYSNVYITSKSMGRVTLGQGSQATDGITEIKLGGALSGLFSAGESEDPSYTAAAAHNNAFDGGRSTGVVYTSPTVAGFVLSAGWYNGGNQNTPDPTLTHDVALRYAGEFGAIRVAAGIGYRYDDRRTGTPDTEVISGSASIMHVPSGLFLNGAYGEVENDAGATAAGGKTPHVGRRFGVLAGGAAMDYEGWGISGGITGKWNSLGNTTLEARYTQFSAPNGANPNSYGVGISQNIDAAAMDIFALFEHYDCDFNCDNNAATSDDVNVATFGMRVRF